MKKYHFLGQETWSKLSVFIFGSYTMLSREDAGEEILTPYTMCS